MITKHRLPSRRTLALMGVGATLGLTAVVMNDVSPPPHTVNAQRASKNWAGYVVQSKSGQSFSSVSGSWTEPSVSASSGQGDSSFWVGLGGASPQSTALEQVGTSADVANGRTQYSAWYELLPAPETKLNMAIHPGDHISARVTVNGTNVTVSLSDETVGQSVSKTLHMSNPDTASAEWIAEAPSTMTPGGRTNILPLANFGKVTFTKASATAGGHTGSISDPNWSVQETQLSSSGGVGFSGGGSLAPAGIPGLATPSSAGASPSSLSGDGSSFSVSYSANAGAQSSTGAESGYAPGYGYGGSGYPGPGYGHRGGGYDYPGNYGRPGYGYGGGYAYVLPRGFTVVM